MARRRPPCRGIRPGVAAISRPHAGIRFAFLGHSCRLLAHRSSPSLQTLSTTLVHESVRCHFRPLLALPNQSLLAGPDAWAPIVKAMRDEELDPERRLLYSIAFTGIEQELWPEAAVDDRPRLSWIRAVDIAIWMGTR